MNPRMRRLTADSIAMRTEFAGHPNISVTPIGYDPPESYRIIYRLRGVSLDQKGLAVMESPIFHPNFGPRIGEEICIGDYWSPAQSLVDIVITIGELIQYQRYNTRSPLNAVAARWVASNESVFPVGNVSLFQREPEIKLV